MRRCWRGWRAWIPSYCVDPASQRRGARTPAGDPGAPHIGGGAHQADERRARAGEAARRAAADCSPAAASVRLAEERSRPCERRSSVVRGGGSPEPEDPGSGRTDRGDRTGALRGRSTTSDASEGSGDTGGADVRADAGRSGALPQEPGSGLLHWSAAPARPIGRKQYATGEHQRGRSVPAHAAGNSAQYILGRFGQDTDVRRWGLKLCARGGGNARKRAVVAVARKLSVLCTVWVAARRRASTRAPG